MFLRLLPALLLPLAASGAEWFVAIDGNDAWSGTLPAPNTAHTDGPFATLPRARAEVRHAIAAGNAEPKTVQIRGGTYFLPESLKFTPEDSGTAAAPVVWTSFESEKPLLIGGRTITDWKPWKGAIQQANLEEQGFHTPDFKQLFFDGKRQPLARYPNYDPENPYGGGWAYADGKDLPMYEDVPGENKRTFHYRPEDTRTWSRPDEVEVFVFARFNWWNDIVRIASLDPEKRQITTARDCSYAIRPGDRYFFQNALEELDSPGEWYLDRKTAMLYFWPPSPLEHTPVFAPTTRTLIECAPKTSYLTFRGFTMECAEGNAVMLTGCDHCLIAANTIRNTGDMSGTAVVINGGTENGVVGNDISEVGRSCISLSGGDRKTLTPAGNYADNNYLHHFGVFYKQGVGVELIGVGNRVAHNLIHDGPRFGILHGGNKNLIEFNRIRHVSLETEDTGGIYSNGRDWLTPRGTVIRYNFISDVLGYGRAGDHWVSPYFAWGIYLDDNSAGVDVIGNIVTRCTRAGIHAHAARDCRVENNIWANNGQWQYDFHGWSTAQNFWTKNVETMTKNYESVVNEPAWKGMRGMDYPPGEAPLPPNGYVTRGDEFLHNIVTYHDPKSQALSVLQIPFSHNRFDENLYWHDDLPLRTGYHLAGKTISENLTPNTGFRDGKDGSLPRDWNWQVHPLPTATAGLINDGAGTDARVLRMDAAFNTEKPRDNYPIVVSSELPLSPGHTYRLGAQMRATKPEAKAALMLQCYIAPKDGAKGHFWASAGNVTAGMDWKLQEFTFRTPSPGESGWDDRMKTFRIRIDFKDHEGSLDIRNVDLREVESLDEWQSWQKNGNDTHSQVADPKFVAPEKDDFRLSPDSPAWKLGFQRIPVEKIGPYQDSLRASWPIVEAEGAREKPMGSTMSVQRK